MIKERCMNGQEGMKGAGVSDNILCHKKGGGE